MKRSLHYLNGILTVLAVLLAVNVWTNWTAAPAGQVLSPTASVQAAGIPDAGAQRQDMVDLLKKLNVSVSEMKTLLTSGKVRVKLEATPAK